MSYALVISDEAALDIEEAFLWYLDIELVLAENFESELYTTLDNLLLYPDSFQMRYKEVRVKFLAKFPYGIHYLIRNSSTVIIVGVFHTSRNPKSWFDRAK